LSPLFLLIETSTSACSVALSQGEDLLAVQRLQEPREQARLLIPLIEQLLEEQQVSLDQCSAIAVSAGPGSYTGLRVGASSAKGLCFGIEKPLIAINSLQIIVQNCIDQLEAEGALSSLSPQTTFIPMMDARRMEVYCAHYSIDGEELSPTQAKIIDADSFQDELSCHPVIFTGDGAQKCQSLLTHPHARFVPLYPSAEGMRLAVYKAWLQKKFVDVAYFEPNYLKDFVTGKACPLVPLTAPK